MKPNIFIEPQYPMIPLGGLIDWVDPSDPDFALGVSGDPVSVDGEVLKQLPNKSAGGVVHNGNNSSIWKQNVQNGNAVWRNTTLNQWSTALEFNNNFASRGAVEIFSVFRPSILTGKRSLYFVSTSAASNAVRIAFGLNGGKLFAEGKRMEDEPSPTYVEGSLVNTTDFKLANALFDYENANIVLSMDGEDWGANLPSAGESFNLVPMKFSLAGYLGQDWRGDIGEILVYGRKLSLAERGRVRDYLRIKWTV